MSNEKLNESVIAMSVYLDIETDFYTRKCREIDIVIRDLSYTKHDWSVSVFYDYFEHIMGNVFNTPEEYERFARFDLANSLYRYLNQYETERADKLFGLEPRFKTEFEYAIMEAVHSQDPTKITREDLDRVVIVK